MLGMLRVREDRDAPRRRIDRLETIGGVSFRTTLLQMRNRESWADRLMLRQSIRQLAVCGVTQIAAPPDRAVQTQLARYHLEEISHTPLMRRLAPDVVDHLLGRTRRGAVLLVARQIDRDVVDAAMHAACKGYPLMLEMGGRGERLRRLLMDECGASPLLGQVSCQADRTAVLLFDKPLPGFRMRTPRPVSVALCDGARADYDDVLIRCPLYGPLGDTDREGVLSAVVSHSMGRPEGLQIDSLVKKQAPLDIASADTYNKG